MPLGGVKNLRVIDPTFTTLKAVWEAADGNVQGYKVLYTPKKGGPQMIVSMAVYSLCLTDRPTNGDILYDIHSYVV